jgi:hypothetical protein
MSEARRYAQLIVATRSRDFEGRFALPQAMQRLAAGLANDRPDIDDRRVVVETRSVRFEGRWRQGPSGMRLEGRFEPVATARITLAVVSVLLALSLIASARVLMTAGDGPARYLVVVGTVLGVLFFMPMLVYTMGSMREGDESRLERAMRVALEDLEPRMPPPQKWKDEE